MMGGAIAAATIFARCPLVVDFTQGFDPFDGADQVIEILREAFSLFLSLVWCTYENCWCSLCIYPVPDSAPALYNRNCILCV